MPYKNLETPLQIEGSSALIGVNPVISSNSTTLGKESMDTSGYALGNQSSTPTNIDISSPITTKEMGSTKTINPTPSTPNVSYSNNLSIIGNQAVENAQVDSKAETQPETSPQDQSIASYLKLLSQEGNRAGDTAELQTEQKVAEKMRVANEINNKILTSSRAYENKIRDLKKNKAGMFGGGLDQEVTRLEKQRDEHLADLSIQKAVANGDLETANSIVEATIKAKYEPIESQMANWVTLYKMYQNDMTESEKFEAQSKINSMKEEMGYLQDLQTSLINDANQSGQSSIASEAMKLDPSSQTFKNDLASLQAKIVKAKVGVGEMSTRQNIVYNSIVTKYGAIEKANATFNVAKATADRLISDPANSQLQLSNLYQYVKTLDANSAVREGETQLAADTASLLGRLQRIKEKYLDEGATVGSDTALKMAKEAKALADAWLLESDSQVNVLRAQARGNGIEQEFIDTVGYADELSGKNLTPPNEEQELLNLGYSQEQIDQLKNQ